MSLQYTTANDTDNEKLKVTVTMGNVRETRPTISGTGGEKGSTLWPREARLRSITYATTIYVEMTQTPVKYTQDGSEEPVTASKTSDSRLCSVGTALCCEA